MNTADFVLIALLSLQLFNGFRNGAINEIIKIIMLIICIGISYFVTPLFVNKVENIINIDSIEQYIEGAFLICFLFLCISTIASGRILSILASLFIKIGSKSMFTKAIGAVLSLLRTFILAGAVMTLITLIIPDKKISKLINSGKITGYSIEAYTYFYNIAEDIILNNNIKGLVNKQK